MPGAARSSIASLMSELDWRLAHISSTKSKQQGSKPLGSKARMPSEGPRTERLFENPIIDAAIVINILLMGLSLEVRGGSWNTVWMVLDIIVTSIFLVELVVRLSFFKLSFFKGWMNWIDFVVVVTSLIDIVLSATPSKLNSKVSLIGLLRLLRLLRLIKIFRVLPKLKMIVDAMIESLMAMCWLIVFLGFMIYVFGILFVMTVGNRDAGFPGYDDSISKTRLDPDVTSFNNFKYFGTLLRAIVTLFNLSMLSDDLAVVLRATVKVQPWASALVCVYIMVATICLMNTIVGMIVQRTMCSWNEHQSDQSVQLKERMDVVQSLASVIFELDGDHNGELSLDEFAAGLENKGLKQILQRIDLPWGFTSSDLFNLLDTSCRGKLSKDEFTNGLFQLEFGSAFQRECRSSILHANLRREILDLKEELRSELCFAHERLIAQFSLRNSDVRNSCAGVEGSSAQQSTGKHFCNDNAESHAWHSEVSNVTCPPASFSDAAQCVDTVMRYTKENEYDLMKQLDQAIELLVQVRSEVGGEACPSCEVPHKTGEGSCAAVCIEARVVDHSIPLEARLLPSSPWALQHKDTCSNYVHSGSFSMEDESSASTSEIGDQVNHLQYGCFEQAYGRLASSSVEFVANASDASDQIHLLGQHSSSNVGRHMLDDTPTYKL